MKKRVLNIQTFIVLFFLGIAVNALYLLAPLHEFWHFLLGFMDGALPAWRTTYFTADSSEIEGIVSYAGYFGEMLSLSAICIFLLTRFRFWWATIFLGSMHQTAFSAWNSSDFLNSGVKHPGAVWVLYAVIMLYITWSLFIYIYLRYSTLTSKS